MRYILLVSALFMSVACMSQETITNGMSGRNARDAINGNFDTLYNQKNTYINVKDYGATGDGVTDDYAAFASAFTDAKDSNKELIIPQGYYVIGSALRYVYTKPVQIRGIGDVTLDFSSISGSGNIYCLDIDYDTTLIGTVSADISQYDTIVYVTSTSGLEKNDYFAIQSTELWSQQRSLYYKGEIQKIESVVNDTTVEIYDYMYDDYNSDSTIKLYETSNGTSHVENLNIIMEDLGLTTTKSQVGIQLDYFNNISVKRCVVTNGNYINIKVTEGKNVAVTDCETSNSLQNGLGYGLQLQSCQDASVENNTFTAARHAITIGGTFPARNNRVVSNSMTSPINYTGTMDTHGSAENTLIAYNDIQGGINLRGIDAIIKDNNIDTEYAGIVYVAEHYPRQGSMYITGNLINARTSIGISFNLNTSKDTLTDIVIKDNVITAVQDGIRIIGTGDSVYIHNYEIEGNTIRSQQDGLAIYRHDYGRVSINNNYIDGGELVWQRGILIYNDSDTTEIGELFIQNNNVTSALDQGIYVDYIEGDDMYIIDNIIDQAKPGTLKFTGNYQVRGNISMSDQAPFGYEKDFMFKDSFDIPDGSMPVTIRAQDTIDVSGGAADTLVVHIYGYNSEDEYGYCEIMSYLFMPSGLRGDIAAAQKFYVFWDSYATGGITVTTPSNLFTFAMNYPTIEAGDPSDDYAEIFIINNDPTYTGVWTGVISNHQNFYKIVTYKQ